MSGQIVVTLLQVLSISLQQCLPRDRINHLTKVDHYLCGRNVFITLFHLYCYILPVASMRDELPADIFTIT